MHRASGSSVSRLGQAGLSTWLVIRSHIQHLGQGLADYRVYHGESAKRQAQEAIDLPSLVIFE